MKKIIIFIFYLINLISCINFILEAGQKFSGYCEKNDMFFSYKNCYFVNNLVPNYKDEFSLIIEKDFLAKCQINQKDFISSDFEILCKIENYFGCMQGKPEIPEIIGVKEKSIFLDNNNMLSFEGFGERNNLNLFEEINTESINCTIYCGDVFLGKCYGNEYIFTIGNLSINYSLNNSEEIRFGLRLKEPKDLTANCFIPKNVSNNTNFNVNCTVKTSNSTDCKLTFGNSDLRIERNPYTKTYGDYNIFFSYFLRNSTIITLKGGDLLKFEENKENYILFNNSNINYKLKENLVFQITYEINNNHYENQKTSCIMEKDKVDIKCLINSSLIKDFTQLKIVKAPYLDRQSITNKSIKFEGFTDKNIYNIIAGQIQKGTYKDDEYIFQFINSIIPLEYEKKIALVMNKGIASCIAYQKISLINCSIPFYQVEDDEDNIIVGSEEPEYIPINENATLYFSGFARQDTYDYSITVGNLYKDIFNSTECRYYFKFENIQYKFIYFDEDLYFNLNVTFNGSDFIANCIINKIDNNLDLDLELLCYLDLNNDFCYNDDLPYYDIKIKEGNNGKIMSSTFENIYLNGFDNKETKTILAKNIVNKYLKEEDEFIFIINYNHEYFTLNNAFNISFNYTTYDFTKNSDSVAKCTIGSENITCISNENSLDDNSDIILKENPINIFLNENQTLYYNKFLNLSTYTIIAGQIEKLSCNNKNDYQFNLKDSIQIRELPKEVNLEIQVKINDEDIKKASCQLNNNNGNKYDINCHMDTCPTYIELVNNDIEINKELFYPDTLFYKEFNNKRTITIKAGKLNKGICNQLKEDSTKYQYIYNITDNIIDYKSEIDKTIIFILKTTLGTQKKNATCILNLSGKDNTTICTIEELDECLNNEFDISITQDIKYNYTGLYPNSIFFEGFENQNTTTIKIKNTSMIIKQKDHFILTDNIVNDDKIINETFFISLKIKYLEESEANCTIPVTEKGQMFNISCYIKDNEYSYENDIEIIEEPTNDNYYFYGYKNKKTLTLTSGSIIKENDNNNFIIINNEFLEEIDIKENKELNFNLKVSYSQNNIDKSTSCNFNIIDIFDKNKINIPCLIPNEITDSNIISILENPQPLPLNDNISLHFYNFEKLNLYTLTLGKIIKKGYDEESKKYIFYFNDTKLSRSINEEIISLPLLINDKEEQINCTIEENSTEFNMKCEINYYPNNNIDLKYYQEKGYYYYTNIKSSNTLYITNQTIISTTLISGNIIKKSCVNNIYKFNIENNILNGNKSLILSKASFNLKLDQFKEEAQCIIESELNINCSVNVNNSDENEEKYCKNMNNDIKINKIYGYQNNNYILINGDIIHFYNFEDLQTYTIEGGEIFKGNCYGNKYQFSINDCKIYNDLYNDEDIDFTINLTLFQPEAEKRNINMLCIIQKNSLIQDKFNIICSQEFDNCLDTFYKKELIIEKNPENIEFEGKIINFQNFTDKSTIIHIKAGRLNLTENDNNYILEFLNSNIDYELNNNINFNLPFILNNEYKTTNCIINKDTTNIIECNLGKIDSDYISIKLEKNPLENNEIIPGKIIFFEEFDGKNITFNILTAGYIKKGYCEGKKYYFSFFNNSFIDISGDFYIYMKKPKTEAKCTFGLKDNITTYVNCYMEGNNDCPVEDNDDIMVEKYEPNQIIMNDNYTLKFFNFKNQNTFAYNIKVGNIKKGRIQECKYYYEFDNFDIYDIYFYENEIIFNLDIYFNKDEFESICKIYNIEDSEKFGLECFFDLNDNYCSLSGEELLKYDLKISDNIDGKRNASNCGRELNLVEFNNKQTVSIFAENIIDKKVENKIFSFIIKINYTDELVYLKNINFNLDLTYNDINDMTAICQINEENNIECNSSISISINNDIKIKSNPDIISLNNTNYTFYFYHFENLKTYTIRASKIRKYEHISGRNYSFYILNCKSPYIPQLANIFLNIKINQTINATALCYLKNLTKYAMKCDILGVRYIPFDIIFPSNTIKTNTSIFSPNTVFFYNFDGKRTLTIKAGKLNKGICNMIEDKMIYHFNFTQNEFYYYLNEFISFNLTINENENDYISICSLNLSSIDNDIICSLENICPKEFNIKSNPSVDYYHFSYISLIYEGFINKEIVTIIMNPEGKIIKKGLFNDEFNFIITNNSILGNNIISEEIEFDLNINDENTFANCLIPEVNDYDNFDISCNIANGISFSEKEIEIIGEPDDNTFYFSGYKNKKTLTLEAGYIVKNDKDENIFYIINNHFMSNYTQFEDNDIEIILDIQYNENGIFETLCVFNPRNINNNYINITCSLPENIADLKYIKVLNNPEAIQLNQNITLNYYNFNKLNINTITLGNIIKDKCESNNYVFYFANTTISGESLNYNLTIPIHINNYNQLNSRCEIQENKTIFNMKCIIENDCPDEFWDISYEYKDYYDYETIKYKSIYIENSYISTTSLRPGYLEKISCENNSYTFSITNNNLTGYTSINLDGEFNIKLKEFNNKANCKINPNNNIININCEIKLENKEEEEYCTNIYKDINIESIYYNDYHYIIINDNILHLYSFENLKTHTVEGGELIKGNCKDNIYEFKIIDSLMYNNLDNTGEEIEFDLRLSQPKELNSICVLPKDLKANNKFNINCIIKEEEEDTCPIDISKGEEIKIKNDPGDIPEKQLNFKNFTGKTTLIIVNAGIISKFKYENNNKKYYFKIENSTITSSIKKDISFNMILNIDDNDNIAKCILNHDNSLLINCEIENIESENINIKITQNPSKDMESIPEKIILFQNFENKQINNLIAGKIQKGKCENSIYSFYYRNSISQIYFKKEFYLQMKEPNMISTCNLINFDYTKKTCDIKCSFDTSSKCEENYEGKDLIASDIEPEYIREDDNTVIYFNNFKNQTTIVYNITVGNLLKNNIDTKECKYYFKFSNDPYKLPNFKEEILFNFNMFFNESEVTSTCSLKEINTGIKDMEYKDVDLLCYFPLNEEICKKDDLSYYDLKIGKDINNKKIVNSSQEIMLVGFDNKETLTISGINIINKNEENDKIYFIINFNSYRDITTSFDFELYFKKNEEDIINNSTCQININDKNIKCEDNNKVLIIDDDIRINANPNNKILNLQTIYFLDFNDKRTFTIKSGQIEKKECVSGGNYIFNLIKTSSKSIIPKETDIEINVLINNNEEKKAICSMKKLYEYNMSCVINDVNCPKNIILNNKDLKPNETLYYPNSLFFNDFNNKRTISIKSGKIKKGECDTSKEKYNYTFINNEIDYIIDKDINFNINTLSNGQPFISKCFFNLNNEKNNINCLIDTCPKSEHDLFIDSNPNADYINLSPNSIFFDDFKNKNTTSIKNENNGMIIKKENEFILTNNYIIENDIIYTSFNIVLKVNINGQQKEAKCTIPIVNKGEIFNISCNLDGYSKENNIEIIEEPINDDYYFYGYKNKKTISLKAGSLIKGYERNQFNIINNELDGLKDEEIRFDLKVIYNNDKESNAKCLFDNSTIICSIQEYIDIKNITVLNNPESLPLKDNITTLYFTNFQNLGLYTLTPGDILKGKCQSNSYNFYLINTTITNSLPKLSTIPITISINNDEEKESICEITINAIIFNMTCTIGNYCPNDINIDIKINPIQISNINVIKPNTLYINNPSEKQSSTINVGYLEKVDYKNGRYTLNINNNIYSGKELNKKEGEFKLKLEQFNEEVNCQLNNNNINCLMSINDPIIDIYKDIKVEKFIGDNSDKDNYIILSDNNILHFYGIENLETFTIKGGDLNQGYCKDNTYFFSFNNSESYNKISKSNSLTFSLKLAKPDKFTSDCTLPQNIAKESLFDIKCSIIGRDGCPISEVPIIYTGDEEPNNLEYNNFQVINFKSFVNKNTQFNLTAGELELKNNGNNNYIYFVNSTMKPVNNSDIEFPVNISIDNSIKEVKCTFTVSNKTINCNLENFLINNDFHIKIPSNPKYDISSIKGKTITFINFENKEINTFIAGPIEKGECQGTKYIFYFRNCKTQMELISNLAFNIKIKFPDTNANCITEYNITTSSYDVKCTIEGTNKFIIESDDEYITIDKDNPSPERFNDLSILYYFNFANQSTRDTTIKYYLSGEILTKQDIKRLDNNNYMYTYKIEKCSLNQALNESYNLFIPVNLTIYEINSTKSSKFNSYCTIPKDIQTIQNFDLTCSFSVDNTFNAIDGYYDILIEKGDEEIKIKEDQILYISNIYDLFTQTIYGCIIEKGQCDNGNKYEFNFTECKNIDNINLEFTLKIKDNDKEKDSTCQINNNKKEINCYIENYSLCEKNINDIIIGNVEPNIGSSNKNIYIIGLKNLYTTTLTGGTINLGKCDSNNFIFNFSNTNITNKLSEDITFFLSIQEPPYTYSYCIIPKNSDKFDLKCTIRGEDECPISDKTSLKIKEITNEQKFYIFESNTLYIKNLYNKKITRITAGDISKGQCNNTKYEFYFINTEITGDIKIDIEQDLTFTLNMEYPKDKKAICTLPKNMEINNKINILCYTEGNKCPMFDYTYIKVKDNPEIDETLISPYALIFSGFENKEIKFEHYYLEIKNIDGECINNNYDFNITTKFNSQGKDSFDINITTKEKFILTYNCTFPTETGTGTTGKIICKIYENNITLNEDLTLNFDLIYLEEKNIYIINQSNEKKFTLKNVQCPFFIFEQSSAIVPSKFSENKSLYFSMNIKTSFIDKRKIEIYDDSNTKKSKNILEYKLNSASSIKNFYRFLKLNSQTEFITLCNIPEETDKNMKFDCISENITDTKAKYFQMKTSDYIKVDNKNIVFSLNNDRVNNPYYEEENNPPDNKSNNNESISTAGKVILIILIILVFVAIVLALLYYFCYVRKKNRSVIEESSENRNPNRNNNNNNRQNENSDNDNNNSRQSENSDNDNNNSNNSSNSSNNPNQREQRYDY